MKKRNEQVIGNGMNFIEKQNLISKVSEGNKIILVDPEGEYKEIAKMLDVAVIDNKIIFNNFNNKKNENVFKLGIPGKDAKFIVFKEREFKKELAPKNANIEHAEIDGEKYVLMSY